MDYSTPGFPVHHQLPEFAQTHVHRVGDAIQPSHPLSPPSPPAFNLSQHQVFFQSHFLKSGGQNIGASASASVLPMIYFRISFRIDWFNLLALQGIVKSLLQQHSLKASIFWCSAFFMVQCSHPYMTTGKNIVLNTDLCQQSDVSAF